jgi:signal transduction histidine kinase
LVEDDIDLSESLAALLGRAGFDVLTALDGRSALDRLRAGASPDVIVLDLMMPTMDGWEFRVEQKRDPVLASIPVVVLTANATAQAAAIDADISLEKPVVLERLVRAIEDVISLRRRRASEASEAHADRLASLGTLAAGIAHEIGNPLAAVVANIALAERLIDERQLNVPDDFKTMLQSAREAADVVRRIVREVSYFSRASDPCIAQDLVEVMSGALSLLGSDLRVRADIEAHHDPAPLVVARRGELLQVFVNLLVNAVQAMSADKRGTIVTRTFERHEGFAVAEVSDTGSGISPHLLGRIFEPFFTTKPPGEGTGLGLSTCQRIVKGCGGKIEVESELGRGTTFRVVLPAAPGD